MQYFILGGDEFSSNERGQKIIYLIRGVISYIFLTVAFWLISWAMTCNHANGSWNPAWRLVVRLRDGFTWFGIVCVGFAVSIFILDRFFTESSSEEQRTSSFSKTLTSEEIEARRIERDWQSQKDFTEQTRKLEEQKLRQEERQKQIAENRENETKRRKTRSAEDAVREALDDF